MRCGVRSGLASLVAPVLVLVVTGVSVAQDRGSVAGRVADDFGDPLADVVVEVLSVSGYRAVARTSVGGWYELPGLVAGVYNLAFSLEGYLPHAQRVEVRAGVPYTVGVALAPVTPAQLSGVVVDQQGLALPGATVEAVWAGGGAGGPHHRCGRPVRYPSRAAGFLESGGESSRLRHRADPH